MLKMPMTRRFTGHEYLKDFILAKFGASKNTAKSPAGYPERSV